MLQNQLNASEISSETCRESSDVEDQILSMFRSDLQATPDSCLQQQVTTMIREFHNQDHRASRMDIHALARAFSATQMPAGPGKASDYFQYLADSVVRHSEDTGSPRFIGHMTSRLPNFVCHLSALIAALNQNVVKAETAKAVTPFERQAIAMLHRLVFEKSSGFYDAYVQNPQAALGTIGSGGTVANLTSLWCARNTSLRREAAFAGIEQAGAAAALSHYGSARVVIIGSALMHYSLEKAAGLLGIGSSNLLRVPVDSNNRVQVEKVESTIREIQANGGNVIALVGVAGTTDTGAIDPLEELAGLAERYNIHFHVDAAWAGPILFSRRHRNKLRGIERASTVTIDGHKQMYLPMGIGVALFRDPSVADMIEKSAQYIIRKSSVDIGRKSLEGSRPANALYLHAGFNIIGAQGYEYLIDEGIKKACYFASLIRSRVEFELIAEPQINIVVYRYVPSWLRTKAVRGQLNAADNEQISSCNVLLQKIQRQAGRSFVSRTALRVAGYGDPAITVLRAVLANPLTTPAHLDEVLEEQVRIGERLTLDKI